jgi:hypothetical protein
MVRSVESEKCLLQEQEVATAQGRRGYKNRENYRAAAGRAVTGSRMASMRGSGRP